jgi:glycosyltransferase involved in cell wall biosynthesis
MKDFELLYLGAFVPDLPEYMNAATSRAAQIFQLDLLDAVTRSEFPRPTVYAYFPVPAFPSGERLVCMPEGAILENGIEVWSLFHINFGPLKVLTLGLSAAWQVAKWAWQNRDTNRVVMTYNLNAPPAFLVGPICRLMKVKFVPFIGDIYVPGEVSSDTFFRRLEFELQTRAIPMANGLIVCNESIIDDFAPERPHLLIEGGVSERLVKHFEEPRGANPGFHVVFAGQLSELNGVQLLLEAMELIDMENLRVTIMGDGPFAHDVRRDALIDKRITYLGLVDRDEVLRQYADADLLLNLRRTEYQTTRYVFPSKIVECMSTGVPLLSTCTGHVEKEFGEFLFLLEDETPKGLAEMIHFVASLYPPSRIEMGRRAQEYVLKNKTWEAQVGKLRTYIEQVFDEPKAA